MKKFEDLRFKDHPIPDHGKIARELFPNGWGVTVVRSATSYGGSSGLYELAVWKDGNIHYDNEVAKGDVLGYLTEEMVTEAMERVQKF